METAIRIIGLFSPSGSHTILVCQYHAVRQYADGNPPNGGVECNGYEKNRDFQPISRFISEMIQDRAILTMADQ